MRVLPGSATAEGGEVKELKKVLNERIKGDLAEVFNKGGEAVSAAGRVIACCMGWVSISVAQFFELADEQLQQEQKEAKIA